MFFVNVETMENVICRIESRPLMRYITSPFRPDKKLLEMAKNRKIWFLSHTRKSFEYKYIRFIYMIIKMITGYFSPTKVFKSVQAERL